MNKKAIQTPAERIKQLRKNILLHSRIYYVLNESYITDHCFDDMCRELKEIQDKNPEASKEVEMYDIFGDWNGKTSNCHALPLHCDWVINAVNRYLGYKESKKNAN